MSTGTETPKLPDEEQTPPSSQSDSGRTSLDSFDALLAITPTVDGAGGIVLESDTGTHRDATASGYDGPVISNAGRYTWVLAWQRWQRMEDSSIPVDDTEPAQCLNSDQDGGDGNRASQITIRDLDQVVWVTEDQVLFPRLRLDRSGAAPINTLGASVGGFEFFELETSGTTTRFYWINLDTSEIETATALPATMTNLMLIGSSRAGIYTDCVGLPIVRRSEALHQNNIVPEGISRLLNGVIPNSSENASATQTISSTKWTEYSPRASGGILRSTTAGAKIALSHLPLNYRVLVQDLVNSADEKDRVSVFVGHGRKNFAGGGGGLLKIGARYGAVEIVNIQGVLYASPVGQFGYSQRNMTSFVAEKSILLAGQSFLVRFAIDGGVGGFTSGLQSEDGWLDAPIDQSLRFIEGATGGSTLFRSEANGGQPYWIDDSGGDDPMVWVDGIAMTTLRNALEVTVNGEGQPAPETCFFQLGTSSMAAVQNGQTLVGKAQQAYRWIWDAIRADPRTGENVQIIASVPGAILNDLTKGATGIREAVLEEIAANTWSHQGPESYDLFREIDQGEIHLTRDAFFEWGRRWSRHYANVMVGQVNNLGPVASVGLSADATRAAVKVVTTDGKREIAAKGNHNPNVMVADYPYGFGFLPTGMSSGAASPTTAVFAARNAASGTYELQTTTALAGSRIIYPVGRIECTETGNFIHDSDGLPLCSFISAELQQEG